MTREDDSSGARTKGWAEHTVVANLPRLFPRARGSHAPLSEVAEPRTLIGMPRLPEPDATPAATGVPFAESLEPRTVVGQAPSRATAQQLLARYAALTPPVEEPVAPEPVTLPLRTPWFRRVASFARDDFRRAPPIIRLLLPALPLVAAATTFLDVDPAAPSLSGAVAIAATSSAAPSPPAEAAPEPLPISSVTIPRRAGHTLASEAADAAARGDRAQAIALYAQLATEQPENSAYASAARILMRDETRNRPQSEQ